MTAIRVGDEFGTLRTALVHDGSNAVDFTMDDYRRLVPPDVLAEHPESAESRRDRLVEQHARFRQLLADEGVGLVSPDTRGAASPPDAADRAFCQVFTRDPCFVVGDTLFVAGLWDEWRHPETGGLSGIRRLAPNVTDLSGGGAHVEGGDVMVFDGGRRVLVGSHRHTNDAGFRRLSDALPGAEVVRVPHRGLHLDCCLAPAAGPPGAVLRRPPAAGVRRPAGAPLRPTRPARPGRGRPAPGGERVLARRTAGGVRRGGAADERAAPGHGVRGPRTRLLAVDRPVGQLPVRGVPAAAGVNRTEGRVSDEDYPFPDRGSVVGSGWGLAGLLIGCALLPSACALMAFNVLLFRGGLRGIPLDVARPAAVAGVLGVLLLGLCAIGFGVRGWAGAGRRGESAALGVAGTAAAAVGFVAWGIAGVNLLAVLGVVR